LWADNFYLNMTFATLAMVVIGGSLSGAFVGIIIVTLVIQALRQLESGVPVGASEFKLPNGSQEVGLAIAWIAFLIFRPRGIMGGTELELPKSAVAASQTTRNRVPLPLQIHPS
jgi:branched-chain amino acid transport system permease protein